MLGVGKNVDIIRESAANVEEAIDTDGMLRIDFVTKHNNHFALIQDIG
jgi:D-alanine-D-alanine ligase-like ATP-grasp enzyme